MASNVPSLKSSVLVGREVRTDVLTGRKQAHMLA